MKYNKSEIMKAAWNLFKMFKNCVSPLSFSVCLTRAWASAKSAANAVAYQMSRNGKTIILNTETGDITGDTYAMRDIIKSDLYATWNAAAKCWHNDSLKEIVAEYKSYLTRLYNLTVAETSAPAQKTSYRKAFMAKANGLCPYCHTYCYGDCRAY